MPDSGDETALLVIVPRGEETAPLPSGTMPSDVKVRGGNIASDPPKVKGLLKGPSAVRRAGLLLPHGRHELPCLRRLQ